MLRELRIRNFAVVENIIVPFAPGFNVLTGETGAGKSILVDALHLVLGGRALSDSVRTGAEECEVQALFRPRDPALSDFRLSGLGLPAAGGELVVRRTVQREGRSRAWVNGALATAGQLQAATRGLLDISGQHEHVGLLDAALHLDLLDAHAQLGELKARFAEAFAALSEAEKARAQLDSDESQRAQRADWLKFQLDELEKAAPEQGEDERLVQERRVLAAAEKLRAGAEEAEAVLSEAQPARAAKRLEEMAAIDPALEKLAQAVRGACAELDEAARELSRYAERGRGAAARGRRARSGGEAVGEAARRGRRLQQGRGARAVRAGHGSIRDLGALQPGRRGGHRRHGASRAGDGGAAPQPQPGRRAASALAHRLRRRAVPRAARGQARAGGVRSGGRVPLRRGGRGHRRRHRRRGRPRAGRGRPPPADHLHHAPAADRRLRRQAPDGGEGGAQGTHAQSRPGGRRRRPGARVGAAALGKAYRRRPGARARAARGRPQRRFAKARGGVS